MDRNNVSENHIQYRARALSGLSAFRFHGILSFKALFAFFTPKEEAVWNNILSVGLILIGITVMIGSLNAIYLNNRFIWNTNIAGINISGKTKAEAKKLLNDKIIEFNRENIILKSRSTSFHIKLGAMVAFDVEGSLDKAFQYGHRDDFILNQHERLTGWITERNEVMQYTLNEAAFCETITQTIPELRDNHPVDAGVIYNGYAFVTTPERDGFGFDKTYAVRQLKNLLPELRAGEIPIMLHEKKSDIDIEKANLAKKTAYAMIRYTLKMQYTYDGYNYDQWMLNLSEIRDWIQFQKVAENGEYKLYPMLDEVKLQKYLSEKIAPYMYAQKENITVLNDHGTPVIKGTLKNGYCLNIAQSVHAINSTWRNGKPDSLGCYNTSLRVTLIPGRIVNTHNEFGLSNVLAVGVTDFSGSSKDRKFNIQHVAEKVQNIFLKPGELFSFVQKMGPVDSTSGYKKELVIINGDSTEPQYGGGVCQVSSTLFRAVFFAGLQTVKRTNHSFEVAYYKPVGLDATVFDPAPDLAFVNDMDSPVFIQNFVDMKKKKIYFFIIGKKDGRKLYFEGPTYDGSWGDYYQYSWTRNVQLSNGTHRTEQFLSIYKNKNVIKKYRPEPVKVEHLTALR